MVPQCVRERFTNDIGKLLGGHRAAGVAIHGEARALAADPKIRQAYMGI
jgi:hypothetical protein